MCRTDLGNKPSNLEPVLNTGSVKLLHVAEATVLTVKGDKGTLLQHPYQVGPVAHQIGPVHLQHQH